MSETADFIRAIEAYTGHQGRPNGKHTRLLCPGHDDHHPSLDVCEGDNGHPVVFCRSHECRFEDICAAIGWRADQGSDEWTPHGPAVAVYDYVDEAGVLLSQVCRTADKQFPQRRPDPTSRSGWRWSLDGVRRVLYRLPRVLEAVERGETIYIAEGEKDVEVLERRGVTATCNPMGAGKWRSEYADTLAGARLVVVFADDDDEGREHAAKVARSLAGRVGEVKLVELWPAGQTKRDVTDWIAAQREDADIVLDLIVEQTPAYEPPTEPTPDVDELDSFEVVPAADFAAVDEPGADPIVGTADSQLIPEGADVVVYGDGGVGKTTLTVDLGYHLAAGDRWHGIPIPRSVRVLLVENEGPRPLFRRKVARKELAWAGSPTEGRVLVLEHPWARFNFGDEQHRQLLADKIAELEVDVVIIGPITATGMDAPGTIPEVREFVALVDDVRARSGRTTLAIILIHHENRAGKPSGSWEGVCDTLIHVTQQGHGRIRIYFQKAKWASDLHATKLELAWAEGDTFAATETEPSRPERVWDGIAEYVLAHGGCTWNDVDKEVAGEGTYKRRRRDAMLEDGVLINAGGKRGFKLWHRDDPARPTLNGEVRRTADAPADAPASGTGGEGEILGASARRSVRTDATTDALGSGPPGATDPDDAGESRVA
jgi:5S rRNA maturation endonuclease (ribonuclease M5)/KaiC/GvpD/RAD55 family RecA-like ATPase